MKGTEGSQVISELKPEQRDHIVPKRFYGAFDSTTPEGSLCPASHVHHIVDHSLTLPGSH
jgi:nicotinamidase-related amidase